MGLFSALNTSTDGLRRTHDALNLISQNVANAKNPNYVRRAYNYGDGPVGSEVKRAVDSYVQKQMWREQSSTGYSAAQNETMDALDQIYGTPDSKSGLSESYNQLYSAFQSLRNDPSASYNRSSLLTAAKTFAGKLNHLSDEIQSLRSGVEDALESATKDANDALSNIADLNKKIGNAGLQPNPSLQDARDAAIKTLTSLLDVTVTTASDGTVSLTTSNGVTLVDPSGARTLTFDSHSPLSAQSAYSVDSSSRTVGTISLSGGGGTSVDLITAGAVKSGRLGGLIDMRDNALVASQSQIDDIAAGISSALSDSDRTGTSTPGGFDLDVTGLQPGNRIKLTFKDTAGIEHKVTIIRVEDPSVLPLNNSVTSDPDDTVIGMSFAGGVAGVTSGLQSALNTMGAGLTVTTGTNGALRITASGSASVTSLSARVTTTSLTGTDTALPFFVDSGAQPFTDSLDKPAQRLGYAGRIFVNPGLLTNNNLLTVYQSPPNQAGDPTRPNDLITRLDKSQLESSTQSNLGLSGAPITLSQMIKQTLQVQTNEINRISSLNDTQKVVQSSIDARFSATSGVQLDQELSDMTQLQNVYSANARVLSAVKDMFDVLMRI